MMSEDETKVQVLEEGLEKATLWYKVSCMGSKVDAFQQRERKKWESRIKFYDHRLAEMGEE